MNIPRFLRSDSVEKRIEPTTTLDPLDVTSRLDELRALNDGWLDGSGVAPSPDGLD